MKFLVAASVVALLGPVPATGQINKKAQDGNPRTDGTFPSFSRV
jgi:hypothetical protein